MDGINFVFTIKCYHRNQMKLEIQYNLIKSYKNKLIQI